MGLLKIKLIPLKTTVSTRGSNIIVQEFLVCQVPFYKIFVNINVKARNFGIVRVKYHPVYKA